MPDPEPARLRQLFDRALDLGASARSRFLDEECAGDAELKQRLSTMLAAAEDERFLSSPTGPRTVPAEDDAAVTLREGPGTRIGPYKLLQQIGEGGFGSVFMAEQEVPVRRKVALKIIKLGMDTRQVVARFEQERQALALMDHPNIARVIDAGATETGRPYFVMDLVKGDPIAEYCDKRNLTIDERLELFAQVCSAVQHAHQKGIIHRDIKPSNVLVATQDGKPQAKVIDFGIAKATSAKLTDKTLFTEHQQVIGTLQYMSPEQAEGSLDIDTRTDVYSLGVLLYELLTGSTPFDARTLREAFYSEVQRMIREDEPPKPSTRLRESADDLASVAARRRVEPKRLGTIVRGELDWIVMKALEKDRVRRYESASGLALDVQRYLSGDAVVAAPPSASYRLRKFVRRNRGTVLTGSAVAASLIAGVIAFAWQARIAGVERDNAVQARNAEAEQRHLADERAAQLEQVSGFQAEMLEEIDPTQAGAKLMLDILKRHGEALVEGHVPDADRPAKAQAFAGELARVNATDTAVEIIDSTILAPAVAATMKKFADQPAVDAALRQTLAALYRKLGLYDKAIPLFEFAMTTRRRVLGPDDEYTLQSTNDLGIVLEEQGKYAEADSFLRTALEGRKRAFGPEHKETISTMANLGGNLRYQGKLSEAEPLIREALELSRRVLGDSDRGTLIRVNIMGYLLIDEGKVAEAEPYWREAYEKGRKAFGPDDPDVLVWTNNLGGLLESTGRAREAETYYREAFEGTRRVHGEEHPSTLSAAANLAGTLQSQGRYAQAEPLVRSNLESRRRVLGDEHPETLTTLRNLGMLLRREGKLNEAETCLRTALEVTRRVLGKNHPDSLRGASMLASLLGEAGQTAEAEELFLEVLDTPASILSDTHPDRLIAMNNLGTLYVGAGRLSDAESILREVLEKRRRVSGDEHPETLVSQSGLARVLESQGKLAEAEALYRDTAAKMRRVLGDDHPNTLNAIGYLAAVLVLEGRQAEAEALYREAIAGLERTVGKDHARTGGAHRALGNTLKDLNRFAEAETELLEAQRIDSIAQGVTESHKRNTVSALITLYEAWDKAEPGQGHSAKAAEWRGR
jgi:serine/threonine protein kinase/tetratricopeptide (TPR) repeat protein